jgi:hypothetical protein
MLPGDDHFKLHCTHCESGKEDGSHA